MKNRFLENQEFKEECARCLNCQAAPCATSCPLHLSPKEFIAKAKQHDYASAVDVIYDKNPLGQKLAPLRSSCWLRRAECFHRRITRRAFKLQRTAL